MRERLGIPAQLRHGHAEIEMAQQVLGRDLQFLLELGHRLLEARWSGKAGAGAEIVMSAADVRIEGQRLLERALRELVIPVIAVGAADEDVRLRDRPSLFDHSEQTRRPFALSPMPLS